MNAATSTPSFAVALYDDEPEIVWTTSDFDAALAYAEKCNAAHKQALNKKAQYHEYSFRWADDNPLPPVGQSPSFRLSDVVHGLDKETRKERQINEMYGAQAAWETKREQALVAWRVKHVSPEEDALIALNLSESAYYEVIRNESN